MLLIRGDHALNEVKTSKVAGLDKFRWASESEIVAATGCRPRELRAAIGPHIGPCCYEVDGPVLAAIPERSVFRPALRPGREMLDLFALNRLQLVGAGIPASRIERVGGCTACDTERYASYRRERGSARLQHFVRRPLDR